MKGFHPIYIMNQPYIIIMQNYHQFLSGEIARLLISLCPVQLWNLHKIVTGSCVSNIIVISCAERTKQLLFLFSSQQLRLRLLVQCRDIDDNFAQVAREQPDEERLRRNNDIDDNFAQVARQFAYEPPRFRRLSSRPVEADTMIPEQQQAQAQMEDQDVIIKGMN